MPSKIGAREFDAELTSTTRARTDSRRAYRRATLSLRRSRGFATRPPRAVV